MRVVIVHNSRGRFICRLYAGHEDLAKNIKILILWTAFLPFPTQLVAILEFSKFKAGKLLLNRFVSRTGKANEFLFSFSM